SARGGPGGVRLTGGRRRAPRAMRRRHQIVERPRPTRQLGATSWSRMQIRHWSSGALFTSLIVGLSGCAGDDSSTPLIDAGHAADAGADATTDAAKQEAGFDASPVDAAVDAAVDAGPPPPPAGTKATVAILETTDLHANIPSF